MSTSDVDSADLPITAKAILKPRKAMPFFGRHPWVFESAIEGVETHDGHEPQPGSQVELWSSKGEFIAHGLWNSGSSIRIRLYSWNQLEPFSSELISRRIHNAIELRRQHFDLNDRATGCRLVFSESDGLSGLVVDSYGGFLVVQFTSLALFHFKDSIVEELTKRIQPHGIWLRTEKGMREAEGLEAIDGLISGDAPPRPLQITEGGIHYGVDIQEGQKTGCYLDQRDNRIAAARYAKGADVLDAFSFSGGFGISAIKLGGASRVRSVDSSESALAMAKQNARLNAVESQMEFERNDVRKELESLAEQRRQFDMVILDPPKMARTRGGISRALKGYQRFNTLGIQVLKPAGILVTCSCSGHVTRTDFAQMLADVARSAKRDIQILEQHGHPCDHPITATCPETEYLKMYICRVL